MNRVLQRASGLAFALSASILSACSSPPGAVSEGELKEIRESSRTISPGQKKDVVFAKYKGSNLVRLSSTQVGGSTIEEWKAEAFHDSGKGRDLNVEFLYFRDGVLVDMSDTRLDFRSDSGITKRWSAGAS